MFTFIWYHILCCLLDSNSFDTLFKYFLRIELADHLKSLAYLSRFRKHDSVSEASAFASLLKFVRGQQF